jgi:hypothetical protein
MTARRTVDPEKIRQLHMDEAIKDMRKVAHETCKNAECPKRQKNTSYLAQNYRYCDALKGVQENYNHNHDARGRFASGGGGGGSAGGGSAKDDYIKSGGKQREWMTEAAKYVVTETGKNGGGTFQFIDGKPEALKNGIMVADNPQKGQIVKNFTPKTAEKYIDKHSETLDTNHAIGTWQNEGKTYLDVVRVFPLSKEKAAIKAGKSANQIAIGKLVNGEYTEIATGGTGAIPG